MKKVMVVITAVVAFSSAAVLGTLTSARAQQQCEMGTQGALAWAIATLIKVDASSGADAIEKLSSRGVKPYDGWGKPEDCVTGPIKTEVQEAATNLLRGTIEGLEQLVETAQKAVLGSGADRGSTVSESGQ